MTTRHGRVDVLLLMQVPGCRPVRLATVTVDTQADTIADPEHDDQAVTLVTLSPTWQADMGEALVQIGHHLQG